MWRQGHLVSIPRRGASCDLAAPFGPDGGSRVSIPRRGASCDDSSIGARNFETEVSIPRRGASCDVSCQPSCALLVRFQSPAGARAATSSWQPTGIAWWGFNPPQGRELRPWPAPRASPPASRFNPPQGRELRLPSVDAWPVGYVAVSIPRRGASCDFQARARQEQGLEFQSPAGARAATKEGEEGGRRRKSFNPPQGRELRLRLAKPFDANTWKHIFANLLANTGQSPHRPSGKSSKIYASSDSKALSPGVNYSRTSRGFHVHSRFAQTRFRHRSQLIAGSRTPGGAAFRPAALTAPRFSCQRAVLAERSMHISRPASTWFPFAILLVRSAEEIIQERNRDTGTSRAATAGGSHPPGCRRRCVTSGPPFARTLDKRYEPSETIPCSFHRPRNQPPGGVGQADGLAGVCGARPVGRNPVTSGDLSGGESGGDRRAGGGSRHLRLRGARRGRVASKRALQPGLSTRALVASALWLAGCGKAETPQADPPQGHEPQPAAQVPLPLAGAVERGALELDVAHDGGGDPPLRPPPVRRHRRRRRGSTSARSTSKSRSSIPGASRRCCRIARSGEPRRAPLLRRRSPASFSLLVAPYGQARASTGSSSCVVARRPRSIEPVSGRRGSPWRLRAIAMTSWTPDGLWHRLVAAGLGEQEYLRSCVGRAAIRAANRQLVAGSHPGKYTCKCIT